MVWWETLKAQTHDTGGFVMRSYRPSAGCGKRMDGMGIQFFFSHGGNTERTSTKEPHWAGPQRRLDKHMSKIGSVSGYTNRYWQKKGERKTIVKAL